jgi:hypothetical protein
VDFHGLLDVDAPFFAIDFEMTGFEDPESPGFSIPSRVKAVQVNSIVQVGIMPMRIISHKGSELGIEPIGPVYKIPVTINVDPRKVPFQEISRKFLLDNDFSFEDWQLQAVHYDQLLPIWRLMQSKTLLVHNGLLDLLHFAKALRMPGWEKCESVWDVNRLFKDIKFFDSRVHLNGKDIYGTLDSLVENVLELKNAKGHDAAYDAYYTGMLLVKEGPLSLDNYCVLTEFRNQKVHIDRSYMQEQLSGKGSSFTNLSAPPFIPRPFHRQQSLPSLIPSSMPLLPNNRMPQIMQQNFYYANPSPILSPSFSMASPILPSSLSIAPSFSMLPNGRPMTMVRAHTRSNSSNTDSQASNN